MWLISNTRITNPKFRPVASAPRKQRAPRPTKTLITPNLQLFRDGACLGIVRHDLIQKQRKSFVRNRVHEEQCDLRGPKLQGFRGRHTLPKRMNFTIPRVADQQQVMVVNQRQNLLSSSLVLGSEDHLLGGFCLCIHSISKTAKHQSWPVLLQLRLG